MNVPKVDIKQLLEAGVHLGHKTLRWNPKMKKYIFGEKNSIHIIDLTQTVEFLKNALVQVHKAIAGGGKLLVLLLVILWFVSGLGSGFVTESSLSSSSSSSIIVISGSS